MSTKKSYEKESNEITEEKNKTKILKIYAVEQAHQWSKDGREQVQ